MKFDKIKILANKNTSCDYHRIILPYSEMGYDFSCNIDIKECNLLIFNRVTSFSKEILLSLKSKYGFKYLVDIDDYWVLDKKHFLYKNYIDKKIPNKIIEIIKNADCVTTTNSQLASKIKEYNKNVHIIPNSLPVGKDQFTKAKKNNQSTVRFIYAGGHSHLEDIKIIKNALIKENINFSLAGFNPNNEQSVKMKDALSKNIYTIANKSLNDYMEAYDFCDVSLAPLTKSEFNYCKSNLKIIEAGCKEIAIIASKTLPYFNDMDKEFVDYAENESDWVSLFRYFKMNKNYVEEKGKKLFEHIIKNYSIEKANEYRAQLISSLLY